MSTCPSSIRAPLRRPDPIEEDIEVDRAFAVDRHMPMERKALAGPPLDADGYSVLFVLHPQICRAPRMLGNDCSRAGLSRSPRATLPLLHDASSQPGSAL
jgi:hypothetical protein